MLLALCSHACAARPRGGSRAGGRESRPLLASDAWLTHLAFWWMMLGLLRLTTDIRRVGSAPRVCRLALTDLGLVSCQ